MRNYEQETCRKIKEPIFGLCQRNKTGICINEEIYIQGWTPDYK